MLVEEELSSSDICWRVSNPVSSSFIPALELASSVSLGPPRVPLLLFFLIVGGIDVNIEFRFVVAVFPWLVQLQNTSKKNHAYQNVIV